MPKITQQQKDAVRMSILDTAREVFSEKGFEAASMKDIVTRSGRSFGGVYLYYANKEDVFLDLIRHQYEAMALDLSSEHRVSAWSRFVYFLEEQEKHVRNVDSSLAPCLYEYFIVGRREESRQKLIKERYEAVYVSIFSFIDDGVQQGEFHLLQAVETFVHWLITFLDGIYYESMINGIEKIVVANQFELLKTVCRSLLMPIHEEEHG